MHQFEKNIQKKGFLTEIITQKLKFEINGCLQITYQLFLLIIKK